MHRAFPFSALRLHRVPSRGFAASERSSTRPARPARKNPYAPSPKEELDNDTNDVFFAREPTPETTTQRLRTAKLSSASEDWSKGWRKASDDHSNEQAEEAAGGRGRRVEQEEQQQSEEKEERRKNDRGWKGGLDRYKESWAAKATAESQKPRRKPSESPFFEQRQQAREAAAAEKSRALRAAFFDDDDEDEEEDTERQAPLKEQDLYAPKPKTSSSSPAQDGGGGGGLNLKAGGLNADDFFEAHRPGPRQTPSSPRKKEVGGEERGEHSNTPSPSSSRRSTRKGLSNDTFGEEQGNDTKPTRKAYDSNDDIENNTRSVRTPYDDNNDNTSSAQRPYDHNNSNNSNNNNYYSKNYNNTRPATRKPHDTNDNTRKPYDHNNDNENNNNNNNNSNARKPFDVADSSSSYQNWRAPPDMKYRNNRLARAEETTSPAQQHEQQEEQPLEVHPGKGSWLSGENLYNEATGRPEKTRWGTSRSRPNLEEQLAWENALGRRFGKGLQRQSQLNHDLDLGDERAEKTNHRQTVEREEGEEERDGRRTHKLRRGTKVLELKD